MSDYVVDASTAVEVLVGKDPAGIALRDRLGQATCHAPHLIDAEVGHSLRRGVRSSEFSDETARTALRALSMVIDHRYPHNGRLSDKAWELRHTVSFYDALYVALAAVLDVPLLTADARLTKSPDLPCRFELIS